jgi:hypothetical protein
MSTRGASRRERRDVTARGSKFGTDLGRLARRAQAALREARGGRIRASYT